MPVNSILRIQRKQRQAIIIHARAIKAGKNSLAQYAESVIKNWDGAQKYLEKRIPASDHDEIFIEVRISIFESLAQSDVEEAVYYSANAEPQIYILGNAFQQVRDTHEDLMDRAKIEGLRSPKY
jgi:hypothetical protein